MDQKQRAVVAADTKRFFDFARELGKIVYRRINQVLKLGEFIELSLELNDKIARTIGQSIEADLAFRDRCHTIINSCTMLSANLEEQKEASGSLMVIGALDPKIEKRLKYKALMASESIQKGIYLAEQIRARANDIVLIDHRMAKHAAEAASRGRDATDGVGRLHETVSEDWSAYCINDKKKEAEGQLHQRINAVMDSADIGGMQTMLGDVEAELEAEDILSASLGAQSTSAAAMTGTAQDLFIDATSIKGLMEEKFSLIRKNLEDWAQLSVILSLEIADYLKVREVLDPGRLEDGMSEEACRRYRELGVLFDIALDAIENLAELNRVTVEFSGTNVKRDEQVMELANMYYHCHDSIRKESAASEKLLSAAADGSNRNKIIGQVLEKNIRRILESYGI